ncbi:N-formylglutamate amidohydrolase [Pelagimonas varians]|uniref:N-formylglutamate amidohydrolase n=1 Tax=Pelagimonas varians TaxID=696760 RepID=A0A238K3K6_9RHOB|nr:N-formylglutamate amidohydrolase [Pelagimonas varians]PYG30488.1 N-formylglutamate deformylase [Pelagimonas varians]SMX37470.1 N-formylglutamate amidohydrolase [Pelagimonas varians]
MPSTSYHMHLPDVATSCVVFASPHSGSDYPWTFLRSTVLDALTIRSSEDAFVDRLFDCVPQFGAAFLEAGAPRAYIDLNRACDELDPALIEGVRKAGNNPRVASGLGVVPRVVAHGRAIYHGKISRNEADMRIDRIWKPYHDRLAALLDHSREQFGSSILLDCHSMPHEAVRHTRHKGAPPQIVIGDRFGASAAPEVVEQVEAAFERAGLRVARNAPFAGAYTTQQYGRPSQSQHAIQIEIDRSIYMDEASVRPNSNFKPFCKLLRGVIADLVVIGQRPSRALAAE